MVLEEVGKDKEYKEISHKQRKQKDHMLDHNHSQ